MRDHPPQDRLVRLYLLGGFRAERAGAVVLPADWKRRSIAKSLVKLLAARSDHRLHREQMLDLLYPDSNIASSLNGFGKALHAARRALEPDLSPRAGSSYILLEDNLLSLNLCRVWIDTDAFEVAAHAALSSDRISQFEAALQIYRGELLPEDRYENWAIARRDALAGLHLRILTAYARLLERDGEHLQAQRAWQQILDCDPLQEEAHRGVMRLSAITGHRQEALSQYQKCRDVLQLALHSEPEPATEALRHDILTRKLSYVPVKSTERAVPPVLTVLQRPSAHTTIGRDGELSVLRDSLASALIVPGQVAMVTGELGVGKSRLLADFAQESAEVGARVLWGGGHQYEQTVPYGPFIEALESYVGHLSIRDRETVATSNPIVAELLPSLAPLIGHPAQAVTPKVPHGQRLAAFAAMFARLASEQPLVLVLDDLHAADAVSLDLLQYLVLTTPNSQTLVLGAYRNEDVTLHSTVHRVLSSLERARFAQRIPLDRLSSEDTNRFVQTLLGDPRVSPSILCRIKSLTLGNPLFIQELVAAMRREKTITWNDDCWQEANGKASSIPRGISELVSDRVSMLGGQTRQVLSLAALAGAEWSPAELMVAAGFAFPSNFDEEMVLDSLDRALEARILEDRGDVYAFRHPLFRESLLAQIPGHRGFRYHAAIATAIELERPGDVEALAFHYGRSREHSKAITYLTAAGERAWGLHANQVAETHFQELVSRVEKYGSDADVCAARERLGSVLSTLARYDEALDSLERAARRYETSEDVKSLVRITTLIGDVHAQRGTWAQGLARIYGVLDSLESTGHADAPGIQVLHATHAWLALVGHKYQEAFSAANRAARIANEASDDRALVRAEVSRGFALVQIGRHSEGRSALERAVHVGRSADFPEMQMRALHNLATVHMLAGEFSQCDEYLEDALETARRVGDQAFVAHMTYRIGVNAFLAGSRSEAQELFQRSVDIGRGLEWYWAAPYPLLGLAITIALEGDTVTATEVMKEAAKSAGHAGGISSLGGPHSLLVEMERPNEFTLEILHLVKDLLLLGGANQAECDALVSACLKLTPLRHPRGRAAPREKLGAPTPRHQTQ